ncbi:MULTISPECIES: MmyB family transcriptional regulator [unclassified Streptomyces]|uniref:MmyB family transcriptional regulator n=1 Tax=unclassified Streptomyces TaxID=2593676 RepID=UPI0025575464|nr:MULTISPECIES: helix-turn-helix domain-containing protein [unclassified Streptomyces]WRZ69474.1 helix-turn-helix transcriptional regulator [Streptomyces sp. NBC_01257]WSU63406.1 helix-turn-helix transcriptional regulator [Streptomyces sp. NBC_01104]
MNKKALRDLLTERRALIDPTGHGFQRPARQGRRAPGLSQHQVDQLCHRTLGTYRRLESGSYPNPPVDLLRDIAVLFALNEQEWVSLCRYAGIGDPPSPLTPRSGKEVPGVWQEAVDGMTHMAYVTDASWELIAYNAPFTRLFPNGRVPANTMRWMLLDPDGRSTLTDWATAWAPLVLPQLRAALATRPDDEVLRRIEKEVAVDPACAPIWESGGAHIHPDGDERPLLHASDGPGWVTMCAAQPMTAPGARLIVLVFHPGARRAHSRVPVLHAP